MRYRELHPWNVSPAQAIKIQEKLASRVVREGRPDNIYFVAGADVSFPNRETARAAVVVLSYPDLKVTEEVIAEVPALFPYIPGLLSFREGPAVLAAIKSLRHEPDLFLFDAQGISHPRRLGLASHMGLLLDKPSIGVAKSKLVGRIVGDKLIDRGEVITKVVRDWPNLRGGAGRQTAFISIGHKISLENAVDLARPEPTLLAHKLAARGKAELQTTQASSNLLLDRAKLP